MKKQNVPTGLGTAIILIFALTAGLAVWRYENSQKQDIAQIPSMITKQKRLMTDQVEKNEPAESQSDKPTDVGKIIGISSFNKWKLYHDDKNKIEFKYPPELHMDTARSDIILSISTISPDIKIPDAQIMNQLIIYSQEKSVTDIISEKKANAPAGFNQATIKVGGVSAEQISHRGAYAGELWIDTLFKSGPNTIVISYPGDDHENKDIFEKIISTFRII